MPGGMYCCLRSREGLVTAGGRAGSVRTGPALGAGVRTREVGAGGGVGRAAGGTLCGVREPLLMTRLGRTFGTGPGSAPGDLRIFAEHFSGTAAGRGSERG